MSLTNEKFADMQFLIVWRVMLQIQDDHYIVIVAPCYEINNILLMKMYIISNNFKKINLHKNLLS